MLYEIKSTPAISYNTLIKDNWRNKFFYDSINEVAKDKVVLDMGTGTGILAFYALAAGAKFVYAVEDDTHMATFTDELLSNKFDKSKFKVINADFWEEEINSKINHKIDLFVSETVGANLFDQGMIDSWYKLQNFKSDNVISIPDCLSVDLWFCNKEDAKAELVEISKEDVIDGDFFDSFQKIDTKFYLKDPLSKQIFTRKVQKPDKVIENYFNYALDSLPKLLKKNAPIISKELIIEEPCILILINKISFLEKTLYLYEASKGMPWHYSPCFEISNPGNYLLSFDYVFNRWKLQNN